MCVSQKAVNVDYTRNCLYEWIKVLYHKISCLHGQAATKIQNRKSEEYGNEH